MSRRFGDERGAILAAGLLFTVALLLVVGVSVDLGRALLVRRELAVLAADAALTGAQQLDLNQLHTGQLLLQTENATRAAQADLRTSTATDTISATPHQIEVALTRTLHTVFLPLLGIRTLTVSATAVAAPRRP